MLSHLGKRVKVLHQIIDDHVLEVFELESVHALEEPTAGVVLGLFNHFI